MDEHQHYRRRTLDWWTRPRMRKLGASRIDLVLDAGVMFQALGG